jgi:hypothetical protein
LKRAVNFFTLARGRFLRPVRKFDIYSRARFFDNLGQVGRNNFQCSAILLVVIQERGFELRIARRFPIEAIGNALEA